MNLSSDEKKILLAVTLQSDLSVRGIAQKLKIRDHKINYTLKKLGEAGVYYFHPFVNYHRLGYLEFNLFISVKGGKGAARQKLIAQLKENPAVKHLSVVGGEYQINTQIWTRSLSALRESLDSLARHSRDIEYHVDTLLIGSITYFAANFLGDSSICEDMVEIAPTEEVYAPDDLDRRILHGLFRQRIPNFQMLSRALGLSASTLRCRIDRLTQQGVLIRMGYMINHLTIGFTHVTLLLKAKRPSKSFLHTLRAFCIQSRAACFLVECFGSWDYQIGVLLEDQTKLSLYLDLVMEHLGDQIDRVVPIPNFETVAWRVGL